MGWRAAYIAFKMAPWVIVASLVNPLSDKAQSAPAARDPKQAAIAEPIPADISPYRALQLRAEAQTELTTQRNFAASLDLLIRTLRAIQTSLKIHRAESEKEQAEIAAAVGEWDRSLPDVTTSNLQRAFSAAQKRLQARQVKFGPGSGGYPFYDTTRFADFLVYLNNSGGALTDVLAFASAIDSPPFESEFATSAQQSLISMQALQEKRATDPCFDFAAAITGQYFNVFDEKDPQFAELVGKYKSCKTDLQSRSEFYRNYYDQITTGVGKLLEISNAASSRVRAKVQETIERVRQLSEQEMRADRLYRLPTTIDDSARWVIVITLVAWMLILAIVVGAIIKMGGAVGSGSVGSDAVSRPFNYVLFLEMMTVFILTATILILGLAAKLDTPALAALIGGISGYVLGRMSSTGRQIVP